MVAAANLFDNCRDRWGSYFADRKGLIPPLLEPPAAPPKERRGFFQVWLRGPLAVSHRLLSHRLPLHRLLMGRSPVINFLLKAIKPRKHVMDRRRPNEDFTCPNCGAHYKLVRMPASANASDPPVHCKVCNHELAPTDGENILKYFLVSKRRRSRSAALTGV